MHEAAVVDVGLPVSSRPKVDIRHRKGGAQFWPGADGSLLDLPDGTADIAADSAFGRNRPESGVQRLYGHSE